MFMDNKKELQKLGKNIKKYRNHQSLSQEELAEIIGMHRTYIGMIERGEKNPTYLTLLKIARGLKINISELVNINENKL